MLRELLSMVAIGLFHGRSVGSVIEQPMTPG
jgi:hypothetical protein